MVLGIFMIVLIVMFVSPLSDDVLVYWFDNFDNGLLYFKRDIK